MHLQFPTYITPRKGTDGEELLGLWSYGWINTTGLLPCAQCRMSEFLMETLQPKRPVAPGESISKGRLLFIEGRVETLSNSLVLHYEVRPSEPARSSARATATFAFNSGGFSLVQSAKCHSKPEAVTVAVLLFCAALPQWIKTLFSRAVEMAPFRRSQLLRICNKTKDWL